MSFETDSNSRDATRAVGEYNLLFVGLACFLRDGNARRVLLPNGTDVPATITQHFAYVAVDPNAITHQEGWGGADATQQQHHLMASGVFPLPKCSIEITGATRAARPTLDATKHDQDVPRLIDADPNARIDPTDVNTVADMTLVNGKLEAFRAPGTDDPVDFPVISRLQVQHDGAIEIRVRPRDGKPERRIGLKPGTDIAIANIAFPDDGKGITHFPIYAQLTKTRKLNGSPRNRNNGLTPLNVQHPIFRLGFAINDGTAACGNTGCCSNTP